MLTPSSPKPALVTKNKPAFKFVLANVFTRAMINFSFIPSSVLIVVRALLYVLPMRFTVSRKSHKNLTTTFKKPGFSSACKNLA
jgi:hypothetical protein